MMPHLHDLQKVRRTLTRGYAYDRAIDVRYIAGSSPARSTLAGSRSVQTKAMPGRKPSPP